MPTIGCTLINKKRGMMCDLMLSNEKGKWLGHWTRLAKPVRFPGKYADVIDFGANGDFGPASDHYNGKFREAISLYATGAIAPDRGATSPAFVHIFCGNWDSVVDRITCGGFVSGEAVLWRTREDIEFELWLACS